MTQVVERPTPRIGKGYLVGALNSGGVVFGLGYALQEEILFDNGKSSPPISASSRFPTSWTFRR
jgi:hypothetical protein